MSEETLRAYLATASTGLDNGERVEVFKCSEVIAQTCDRFGVSLYQPQEHTDPIKHADKSPREVYMTDRERVATSDVVLALCTHSTQSMAEAGCQENSSSLSRPLVFWPNGWRAL